MMRPVSIADFIEIVFSDDSYPPAASTIRRLCSERDCEGRPIIPGAFKFGKLWKIDLDVYYMEMAQRTNGAAPTDDAIIYGLARSLAS